MAICPETFMLEDGLWMSDCGLDGGFWNRVLFVDRIALERCLFK